MALTFTDPKTQYAERPGRLSYVTPDEEMQKAIRAALEEWALQINYQVTYDDDDGSWTDSNLRYKELYEPNVVVIGKTPVGILLEHTVYANHNSNCSDTYLYVLYFKDAGTRELKLEGERCGNRYVEGTAFYSLRRRQELAPTTKVETAGSQFFPVPHVF